MSKISIIKYVDSLSCNKLFNVLELGSGDQKQAIEIASKITGNFVSIDKIRPDLFTDKNILFINDNFFNLESINNIIKDQKFDLIFSNYSLCFNRKESIIECLPYYFEKLSDNGIFYIVDFASNEEVVKKRTNLDDKWFFDLINTYFEYFDLIREHIYEEEHGHNHKIFELIAHKSKV